MHHLNFLRSTLFLLCLCVIAILPSLLASADIQYDEGTIAGTWVTEGYGSRVEIKACATNPNSLCGQITWLWDAFDEHGDPMLDQKNPVKSLRSRTVIGTSILSDFQKAPGGIYKGGTIYNPEDGRTYRATLELISSDRLQVRGCVIFICQKQIWLKPEAFQ